MPFTDEGYRKKEAVEIIREKEELFSGLFNIVNNSVSDILWQWMKAHIYERQEIEELLELGMEQISISDAVGAFLDKHGIECGITRKGATKAQGYVEVSGTITGLDITIPQGTRFSSARERYRSDKEEVIPGSFLMTKIRTGYSKDFFEASIIYVEDIFEIRNSLNEIIDSSYYSLDTTYHNNIEWTPGSSAVIIKDEVYTVYTSGTVKKRIEITSENTGLETNTSVGSITTCDDIPGITVTNAREVTGGHYEEFDEVYKRRLLNARRRSFTLERVRDLVMGIEGVRSCKVFQDVGTDQTSVSDWDDPVLSTVNISGTVPLYSQSFVPGDHVLTLGKIVLQGDFVNNPPALMCGVKRDVDDYGIGVDSPYFDYNRIESWELDQSAIGYRDIEFILNYNGLDKTKTYRFDVWCEDPEDAGFDWTSNYWELGTTSERYGSGSRYELYAGAFSGSTLTGWVGLGDNIDLIFKTQFKGAGYSIMISPEDGYGFTNLKEEISPILDYVSDTETSGFSPICIQTSILESTEIYIDVRVIIYISQLADFSIVKKEISDEVERYLEKLDTGENVIYSKIWHIIMNNPLVLKLEELYIKRSTNIDWIQRDIKVFDEEIPDLGAMAIQYGGRVV